MRDGRMVNSGGSVTPNHAIVYLVRQCKSCGDPGFPGSTEVDSISAHNVPTRPTMEVRGALVYESEARWRLQPLRVTVDALLPPYFI
jgi:hypothetical protein